ncbi:MAG: GNAT family N-acetyltransferase [Chitinophagales bacterium]|nr:GNAT family N-acetyltransferase [Chitinophagales bacterium]
MAVEIKQVKHKSKAYWQLVNLRSDVLRKPLGLVFSKEELEQEDNQWHYGIFENKHAIACMILVPQQDQKIKMRQVCTQTNRQGQGYGKMLLDYCENDALKMGFTYIYCHARLSALPFYQKENYQIKGTQFEEVGLPHYYLFKHLK